MLTGRFAQGMELLGIVLLLGGGVALCQPFSMAIYTHGFKALFVGWLLLNVFSHRRPVR